LRSHSNEAVPPAAHMNMVHVSGQVVDQPIS
jgi:hypothetical protein